MSKKHSKNNGGGSRDSSFSGGAHPSRSMSRRAWLGFAAGGAALALGGERWWRWNNPRVIDATKTPILVYASPSCACCHKWIGHLGDNGFDVTKELVADVTPLKKRYGVPEHLWSCHTAVVDGYAIEGHVPADLIQRMLSERPNIAGLAAPGMPNGAPGMEGPTKDRYEVVAFTRSGETSVYAMRG
jgi:hypothetical protein